MIFVAEEVWTKVQRNDCVMSASFCVVHLLSVLVHK